MEARKRPINNSLEWVSQQWGNYLRKRSKITFKYRHNHLTSRVEAASWESSSRQKWLSESGNCTQTFWLVNSLFFYYSLPILFLFFLLFASRWNESERHSNVSYFCINAAIRQKNVSSTECGRDRLLNNDAMREVDEIRVLNNDFILFLKIKIKIHKKHYEGHGVRDNKKFSFIYIVDQVYHKQRVVKINK